MAMMEQVSQAAFGAFMGAGYGYWGFKKLGKGEKLSKPKLIRATLSGALAGAAAAYMGIPLEKAEDLLLTGAWATGVSFALDQAAAFLWRKLRPKKAPAPAGGA